MATRKDLMIEYFQRLDRRFFMDINKDLAHLDNALPIGYGQTISQPSLVLAMTLLLDLKPHSKVLEIGTGSGYQTALLAPFVKSVYTVERLEPLYNRAIERLESLDFDNIYFKLGDGSIGWEEHSPFDRIMVTAAASEVPKELIEQLAPLGKMIIPVGPIGMQELILVKKNKEGQVSKEILDYVRFVRLVGKYE